MTQYLKIPILSYQEYLVDLINDKISSYTEWDGDTTVSSIVPNGNSLTFKCKSIKSDEEVSNLLVADILTHIMQDLVYEF